MALARGFTSAEDFAQNVGYNKKTILYVGGLSDEVNEEVLHGAFIPFGELVQVNIPRDPGDTKHRGFGFVEFEEAPDAKHAMDNMQDSELFGRVIKCNIAKPNALKARAVWEEADKWYSKTLGGNAEDVASKMRRAKDAADGEAKEGKEEAKKGGVSSSTAAATLKRGLEVVKSKSGEVVKPDGRYLKKKKVGHPEPPAKKKMSLSSREIWGKYFFKVL